MLATPQGVFIGVSARTDAAGADALVGLLAEIGQRGLVVAMPPGVLHFKSDCALIGEETVPSTARLAASGAFAGFRVLILPEGEEGAANALRLGDEVLVSQGYPHTAERLARRLRGRRAAHRPDRQDRRWALLHVAYMVLLTY